jgi:hypothetical protein
VENKKKKRTEFWSYNPRGVEALKVWYICIGLIVTVTFSDSSLGSNGTHDKRKHMIHFLITTISMFTKKRETIDTIHSSILGCHFSFIFLTLYSKYSASHRKPSSIQSNIHITNTRGQRCFSLSESHETHIQRKVGEHTFCIS